ncbi:MAG: hypothetical protein P4L56_00565 [Candidatus Sulfopaludibacter sp.]|nr:hypothetical protein [Candidatus Sulfopaludibacter sp.]
MKFASLTLALASVAALTGCTNLVSLNPFVTGKQAILDANLAGTWKSGDDDSLLIVQQNSSSYSVTYTDGKGTSLKLTALVFQAGDAELLDLVSENEAFLQVPVHAVVRVWPEGSLLRWTFLDSKWLREQVGKELASQPNGEGQLLTAPGETVRSVLAKYGADSKAFENAPNVMTRVP